MSRTFGPERQGAAATGRHARRAVAAAIALTFAFQGVASATCSDGTIFPLNGYVVGQPPIVDPANFSPHVFTAAAGSLFIPDASLYEHNDPAEALTGGGHNWVFDQGSTLCKQTDVGPAGQTATGWNNPPSSPTNCVLLPIIKGGVVINLGDIPFQGDAITPTCNPAALSTPGNPNPANSYLNQLGCSISASHNGGVPVATTPQTATSYLFVAGVKGGLFSIALDNVANPVNGGDAGKVNGPQNYYSRIPEGQKLTNAAVSPDGKFAIVTSIRRSQAVWACLNPLGDPGDPAKPLDPSFFVPPGNLVKCMEVGSNALAVDLTTAFGPDNQPYFGGQRIVTSFNSIPGGSAATAWPNCIWQRNGSASLQDAFDHNRQNGCGSASPNFGFSSALVTQPQALVSHKGTPYMYTGPFGGTVVQFKVTVNPVSGRSQYQFRTYLTGVTITTGIGIADDLRSLIVMSDPSAVGFAGQEVMTRLPLCEDM